MFVSFTLFFAVLFSLLFGSDYSNTVLSNRILINEILTNYQKKKLANKNSFKLLGMDFTENYFVYRDREAVNYVDCQKQLQYRFFYDNPVAKKKIYLQYNKKFNIEPRKFKSFYLRGDKIEVDNIVFEVEFLKNKTIQIFNTFEGKKYLILRVIFSLDKINLERIVSFSSGWAFILINENRQKKNRRKLFFIHKKNILQKNFALYKRNNYQLSDHQKKKNLSKNDRNQKYNLN